MGSYLSNNINMRVPVKCFTPRCCFGQEDILMETGIKLKVHNNTLVFVLKALLSV